MRMRIHTRIPISARVELSRRGLIDADQMRVDAQEAEEQHLTATRKHMPEHMHACMHVHVHVCTPYLDVRVRMS